MKNSLLLLAAVVLYFVVSQSAVACGGKGKAKRAARRAARCQAVPVPVAGYGCQTAFGYPGQCL